MGKISENFEGTQHNGYWVSNQSVFDIINGVGFDTFIEEYSEYRVPKKFNNRQVFGRRNNDGNTYFSTDIETDNACLILVYDHPSRSGFRLLLLQTDNIQLFSSQ